MLFRSLGLKVVKGIVEHFFLLKMYCFHIFFCIFAFQKHMICNN